LSPKFPGCDNPFKNVRIHAGDRSMACTFDEIDQPLISFGCR
jgi:hypothetical protein